MDLIWNVAFEHSLDRKRLFPEKEKDFAQPEKHWSGHNERGRCNVSYNPAVPGPKQQHYLMVGSEEKIPGFPCLMAGMSGEPICAGNNSAGVQAGV